MEDYNTTQRSHHQQDSSGIMQIVAPGQSPATTATAAPPTMGSSTQHYQRSAHTGQEGSYSASYGASGRDHGGRSSAGSNRSESFHSADIPRAPSGSTMRKASGLSQQSTQSGSLSMAGARKAYGGSSSSAAGPGGNTTPRSRTPRGASSTRVGSGSTKLPPVAGVSPRKRDGSAARSPRHTVSASLRSPRQHARGSKKLIVDPRPAILEDMPELEGCSTRAMLSAMEGARQTAESEGRYLDAQEFCDRMRALTMFEGQETARKIEGKGVDCPEAMTVMESNRQQLFDFTRLWEGTMAEFDAKAEKLLNDTQTRHTQQFEEEEELLRSELSTKRPHFSKRVIQHRELLQRKVQTQQYVEAEQMKIELQKLEGDEIRCFEEQLSKKFAAKTKLMKKKFSQEISALKQRISTGRDELQSQRKLDYTNLIQRHQNAVAEAVQRNRTEVAKEQKALERQMRAVVENPTKKTIPMV